MKTVNYLAAKIASNGYNIYLKYSLALRYVIEREVIRFCFNNSHHFIARSHSCLNSADTFYQTKKMNKNSP